MLPLTPEKEANRWKIAKKWLSLRLFVAMATVYSILILMKKNTNVVFAFRNNKSGASVHKYVNGLLPFKVASC